MDRRSPDVARTIKPNQTTTWLCKTNSLFDLRLQNASVTFHIILQSLYLHIIPWPMTIMCTQCAIAHYYRIYKCPVQAYQCHIYSTTSQTIMKVHIHGLCFRNAHTCAQKVAYSACTCGFDGLVIPHPPAIGVSSSTLYYCY